MFRFSSSLPTKGSCLGCGSHWGCGHAGRRADPGAVEGSVEEAPAFHVRKHESSGGDMGFIDTLLGRKQPASSSVAKERLLTVLVHDRVKLPPDMLDAMRAEIVAVISKYVEISDPNAIDVSL